MGVPEPVLDAYGVVDGEILQLAGGRTNRTVWVRAGRDLVLQQLNPHAGLDLLGVMENIVRVSAHLGWKHAFAESGPTWWPELVPTTSGKPYLIVDDGHFWRAFVYREGTGGTGRLSDQALVQAARLFGRFTGATADLGEPPLIATNPGFHKLDRVHDDLAALLDGAAPAEREPVDAILVEFRDLGATLERRIGDDGFDSLPDRVVHNDTKLSNVLMAPDTGRPCALLDFDLVMPGPLWHDTGDFLRSAAWHAGGDEHPALAPELFADLCRAYVGAAAETVSPAELATLAAAGPRLAYELGLRYLSDYLRPEPVLGVAGPQVSLIRGRTNLVLAAEMLSAYDALRFTADELISTPARQPEV